MSSSQGHIGPFRKDMCPHLLRSESTSHESAFIVLGEGLAAGMGNFSLASDTQRTSFPSLMAVQMGAHFVQTLIQPPGIGDAIGFESLPVVVPSPLQSTVLEQMPPDPPSNLSVPGLTVSDAVRGRPCQPLIDRTSSGQTALNLLLGAREIYLGTKGDLPTPLEIAMSRKPRLALVSLGYAEALRAATSGNPRLLPDVDAFRRDYSAIVGKLRRGGAQVVALTIPDPLDTAYFSSTLDAAHLVKISHSLLLERWHVREDEWITPAGLNEIACQLYETTTCGSSAASIRRLSPAATLSSKTAQTLRCGLQALNGAIKSAAGTHDARLYDLHGYFGQIGESGADLGFRRLTGKYLGGFFCLNGYYPGATGHALIANQMLGFLNREFGSSFRSIDLASVVPSDPVAAYKPAEGPNWTRETLATPPPLRRALGVCTVPREGKIVYVPPAQSDHVIRLPATLEQVLDLNPDASYFGDALTAQHCTTPGTIAHGSGYNLLFGGFAMMDSHLSGKVRITFTAPQGDWTTFQVRFEGGLRGAEAVLAAPVFFRMPGQQQSVEDVPGKISQGRLNLRTGEVNAYSGEVSIWASFFNTALFALRQVNPHLLDSNRQRLLDSPLSFPGEYGSAFVRFDPRPDGTLDFTFCGTTFVPLGAGASFPLNFSGPSRQFASIPASGTVLHPHIAITTRASEPPADKTPPPDIRFNTLQEYTLFSPISSFGDLFTLDAPELGGRALGRSRLLGRLQVQFGPRCGNSVPIVTSLSSAGGLLAPLNPSPIADAVESQGGRLMPGPEGFGTLLRFPLRTYALNDLFVTDDMFDISVGALDVRTGELIHPLVHRGFINQDVIFALLRIEPRTRRDSFHFRGPGSLKMARRKGSVFRSFGQIYVPYPAGYKFPETNLSTGIVTNGGRLDPYLWIWAVQDSDEPNVVRSGKADRVLSGKGELFSYRLTIPSDVRSRKAEFVYENHSQNAKFTMHSLAWVGFGNSGTGGQDDFDTVTFSCFGVWSSLHGKDQIVQAAVQLSKAQRVPWLGVQIARAEIGDADTPLPPTTYPVPALGGLVFNSQTR